MSPSRSGTASRPVATLPRRIRSARSAVKEGARTPSFPSAGTLAPRRERSAQGPRPRPACQGSRGSRPSGPRKATTRTRPPRHISRSPPTAPRRSFRGQLHGPATPNPEVFSFDQVQAVAIDASPPFPLTGNRGMAVRPAREGHSSAGPRVWPARSARTLLPRVKGRRPGPAPGHSLSLAHTEEELRLVRQEFVRGPESTWRPDVPNATAAGSTL